MDLDTKQTKITLSQNKKTTLTLEARHSKSIEASNKIRSKLSPRLFIPRLKCKTQYFSKELKSKNGNLTNLNNLTDFSKEYNTFVKCQIDNWTNRLKEKNTKKPQFRKRFDKMENNKNNLFQNKYQNIKILRKNMQKIPKDSKLSFAVDKQNVEKATDIKIKQNDITPSNTQNVKAVKDNALRNCGNENSADSASYLTDGEIIFIDDSEELYSLYEDENTTDLQDSQSNAVGIFEKPVVKNCMETPIKTNGNRANLQVSENDSGANSHKKTHNSLASQVKESKNSKQTNSRKTAKNRNVPATNLKAKIKAKDNYKKMVTKNVTVLARKKSPNILRNSLISLRKKEDCEILNAKLKEKGKLESDSEEENLIENTAAGTKLPVAPINIRQKTAKLQKQDEQPVLDILKPKESNLNLFAKQDATRQSALNVTNTNESKSKSNTNGHLKYNHTPVKTPLDSYLCTVTSAIADFQDVVRSSIYDCSPNDQKINDDLNELENCVKNFSKYVLKSYNDAAAKEFDIKHMESIRNLDVDRTKDLTQNGLQKASLNRPKHTEEATESLTIIIEADKMPTKFITFKSSDIMGQKQNEYCDGTRAMSKVSMKSNCEYATNDDSNSIPATQTLRNNKKISRCRRKVAPKILKHSTPITSTPILNTPYHTSASAVEGQEYNITTQPKNSMLYTNPFNLIYTQAPNNSFSTATNSFNLPTSTKRYMSSLMRPVLIESPATVAENCYSYSPAVQNVSHSNLSLRLSEEPRQHVYQPTNQILNYNPYPNHFDYQNTLCRVSHLQNRFNQHFAESNAYNSQLVNNFSTFLPATNFPAADNL